MRPARKVSLARLPGVRGAKGLGQSWRLTQLRSCSRSQQHVRAGAKRKLQHQLLRTFRQTTPETHLAPAPDALDAPHVRDGGGEGRVEPTDPEEDFRERAEEWHDYMLGVAQLKDAMRGGGGGSAASRRRRKKQEQHQDEAENFVEDEADQEEKSDLATALGTFLNTWCSKQTQACDSEPWALQLRKLLQSLIDQNAPDEQVAQKVKALLAANQRTRTPHPAEAIRAPQPQRPQAQEETSKPSRRVVFATPEEKTGNRPNTHASGPKPAGGGPPKAREQPQGGGKISTQRTVPVSSKQAITAVMSSEWTSTVKLASLAGVRKALATGGSMPGNLVLVNSVDQFLELRDQWIAVACYEPMTVIIDGSLEHDLPGGLQTRASVKRGSGGFRVETIRLASLRKVLLRLRSNQLSASTLPNTNLRPKLQCGYLRRRIIVGSSMIAGIRPRQ